MRYEWSGGGRSSSLLRMTGCFPISNPAAQMSDICQSQRLGRVRRQHGAPAACTVEQEVLARGENRVVIWQRRIQREFKDAMRDVKRTRYLAFASQFRIIS